MDPSIDLDTFSLPSWLCLSGSFLISLIITWISIPTIVKISKFKKLHAHINERTSHHDDTPNLGGVAVFAATALSIIIFSLNHDSRTIGGMLGGMIVLFLIGIKDDILIIDPNKKFAEASCISNCRVAWRNKDYKFSSCAWNWRYFSFD